MAEMAIVLPFLLILVLGIVEFGSMFSTSHTLTSLGREGANIAARGASLDTVNALVLENGSEIHLTEFGGVISSQVVVEDSVPTITSQAATEYYGGLSRLGNLNDAARGMESMAGAEGVSFRVVEIFYVPNRRTPLRALMNATVPDTLYSRAVF